MRVPHRSWDPCPPWGAPLPPPELAGRGHRPVGLQFSKRTASSERDGVGWAGQRGPGTRARRERGTYHFLVGSLRSRARGARGPPGRWRRRRQPGSGGRGDEPARESTGSHIPGRAVRPGRRSGPGPRAHASHRPLPGPSGRCWLQPRPARGRRIAPARSWGGTGAERGPPAHRLPGESAWGARAFGLPPGRPSHLFPGPGGTRGKFGSQWWGSASYARPSPSLGACRVSQPWVVERGATSPIRDGQV